MRWPVFLLIWLKLIFSDSEVAGNNAMGHVTSDNRKKPFQLARGAMNSNSTVYEPPTALKYRAVWSDVESGFSSPGTGPQWNAPPYRAPPGPGRAWFPGMD